MFDPCFSIFLILLLVFATSSNAIKCEGSHQYSCPDFSTCTGYICKNANGNTLSGSGCTEEVNNKCQLGWDHTKIKSVAQGTAFQSEIAKYFVFSCQSERCDTEEWMKKKKAEYKEEIKDAGIELGDDGNTCKVIGGRLVECHPPFKVLTFGCDPMTLEIFNAMSDGRACLPGNPLEAKQMMVCEQGKCKCLDSKDRNEISCDKNVKFSVVACDLYKILTEEQKRKIADKSRNSMENVCSSKDNGYDAYVTVLDDNGAETIGNGFGLLMAPIFASLFLR